MCVENVLVKSEVVTTTSQPKKSTNFVQTKNNERQ